MLSKAFNFIHEVKAELRKASWPWDSDPKAKGFKKYKELVDSTLVVLVAMILLAGFVAFFDILAAKALNLITTTLGQ
ncbi:preprotein translocase subunit SecE [Persicirhabdus sediminis]|uniref:Preprotein translocase subunit SecE n=1 Tax=Persicirhabdus sediminis TaxID=454144 RepID=A0A8J7MD22_9BACT|nr:preprotein translocase subunit SecE [Persicirhabdus sediminis]MBK1790351.1 preprotein translocase subunit SecE [Persicirhabdus sediminis]